MKKTFFDKEPGIFRGIQGTIIVAGLAAGGYILYREWKKNQEEKQANAAADAAAQHLRDLAAQGITPTLDASQLEIFSQQLVEAMSGCGTDEDSIHRVFRQLSNDADVAALIVQFGVRYYQPCVWTSPVSFAIWEANDQAYGGGLPTWFGYDLSDSNIEDINDILTSKGITYKF
jgi:hypothetical protein